MIKARNLLVLCFFSLLSLNWLQAQVIYNAYASITAQSGTSFTVGTVNETNHTFAATESVVIMQMQDDVIGTNTTNASSFGDLSAIKSAGVWEVAVISSVTRTSGVLQSLTFASALTNTYAIGANSSLQIITLRSLSPTAFTSSANITGLAWNGSVGGVVALYVGTVFTLGHNISANAIGFRGGVKNNVEFASTSCDATFVNAIGNKWAGKGEGIYKNTDSNLEGARGKLLNGGGGGTDENSGGGGGGNYTSGGMGGPGYTGSASGCSPSVGGIGGLSLSSVITGFRIFMGGGGGGGHENNNVGTVGGIGGGIVLLKTGTLTTSGSCGGISITANAGAVANSGNDGSGGGGAAGSIVLNVNAFSIASTCTLNVTANGSNGGSCTDGSTHSGGGGGAQGIVLYSTAQPTTNMVTATNNGNGGCNNSGCSSAAISASGTNNSGIFSVAANPLPVELKSFSADKSEGKSFLKWITYSEKNSSHFEVERTGDGIAYKTIAIVKSKSLNGNSAAPIEYSFIDINPEEEMNYYRLKLVDLDQSYKYSFVVTLNFEKLMQLSNLSIFPNPSNGQFFLQLKNSQFIGQLLDISLSDISGRELAEKTIRLSSSEPLALLDALTAGYYNLKISAGTQHLFFKLIVN